MMAQGKRGSRAALGVEARNLRTLNGFDREERSCNPFRNAQWLLRVPVRAPAV